MCRSILPRAELASTSWNAATVWPRCTVRGFCVLPARKCQQLPRERFAARGGGEDRFERADILLVSRPAQQRLRLAAHDHQQVVEVVRDAAGQLAERLHFLRLRKLLVRPLERFLRIALFGDVARDLGKADKFA